MKKVLFVCVENARRSQMAEAMLNRFGGDRTIAFSAGTRPAFRVDPKVIEVMKEIGIDLSKQRPRLLTIKMVEESDMVITMGCEADVCPAVPKQLEEWRIEDPTGKSIAEFREVRNKIKKRVEKLIEALGDSNV